MKRGRLHLLLIPLAALIPILPLLVRGCSCGHDFDFHILNWLEAARQFTHGTFHPQWTFTPAWNAGEPRFVFYPPISWTIGAILGLILPWTWTPIAYTWLVLTAAGFALHHLARTFVGPTAALLAAVFYLTNPYTLFTAYERTAYAELLAAIWIPLLLDAILRQRPTIPRIAVPIALLWLSNAPAAVISCYALALLAIVRLVLERQHRLRLAVTTVSGTVLGLGLAAFYLVPAAWERRYVQIQMAILPGLRIQDNFLFHHTTAGITDPAVLAEAVFHDNVLHTASVIAILFLLLTTVSLGYYAAKRDPSEEHDDSTLSKEKNLMPEVPRANTSSQRAHSVAFYSLATVTFVIAILLTPLSQPIWHYAPELAFLQFPWRILSLLAVVLGLSVALILRDFYLKPAATVALAVVTAAVLTFPAYLFFRQSCDPEDSVAGRTALFLSNHGTEPTDEYTPTTADNDVLSHSNPPYWLASDLNDASPSGRAPGPAPTNLAFRANQPGFLILNLRDYPIWDITSTDTHSIALDRPKHLQREDGLIALPIYYAADFKVAINRIRTPDQKIGEGLSLLAVVVLIVGSARRRYQPETNN